MKITRKHIRQILREEGYYGDLPKTHADGTPWPGSLEDLAAHQGRTWGHGEMVDAQGFKSQLKKSERLAKVKDDCPLRLTENQLRALIRHAIADSNTTDRNAPTRGRGRNTVARVRRGRAAVQAAERAGSTRT